MALLSWLYWIAKNSVQVAENGGWRSMFWLTHSQCSTPVCLYHKNIF